MANYPDITVGDPVTADLLISMLPQFARKSSDQAVTSSTTLVNDSELFLPMITNASYFYEGWLLYTGASNTPDLKLNYFIPAGATLLRTDWGHDVGTVSVTSSVVVSVPIPATTDSLRGAGSDNTIIRAIYAQGEVITAGTAGNFQVRFAQSVSDAAAITMKAGSRIKLTRYA